MVNREEIAPLQIQIQPTKQPQALSSCTETQASWQEAWEPLPPPALGSEVTHIYILTLKFQNTSAILQESCDECNNFKVKKSYRKAQGKHKKRAREQQATRLQSPHLQKPKNTF